MNRLRRAAAGTQSNTQSKPACSLPPARPDAIAEERRYLRGAQNLGFETVHALQIFREYFRALRALRSVGPCITIFGSARLDPIAPAYQLGRDVGARIARAGFTVMTGGGGGLM